MGACNSTSSVHVAPNASAITSDAANTATPRPAEPAHAAQQGGCAAAADARGEGGNAVGLMEALHVALGQQVPMYTQIGHTLPRNERGEWEAKLKAPVELKLRARDPVLDAKILRGELEDAVRTFVLHE